MFSVEHDKSFFDRLYPLVKNKCSYILREPDLIDPIRYFPDDPDLFQSSDNKSKCFKSYAHAIEHCNQKFDIIIVDGRARPSCMKCSIPYLKSKGLLVLDNSNRNHYISKLSPDIKTWRSIIFRGSVMGMKSIEQTTIYFKP